MHVADLQLLPGGGVVLDERGHGGDVHLDALFAVAEASEPLAVGVVLVLAVRGAFTRYFNFLRGGLGQRLQATWFYCAVGLTWMFAWVLHPAQITPSGRVRPLLKEWWLHTPWGEVQPHS